METSKTSPRKYCVLSTCIYVLQDDYTIFVCDMVDPPKKYVITMLAGIVSIFFVGLSFLGCYIYIHIYTHVGGGGTFFIFPSIGNSHPN